MFKWVDHTRFVAVLLILFVAVSLRLRAHNGPPFPVITDRAAGKYILSLWADPDATTDGDADGRFWVIVKSAGGGQVPDGTEVRVSIWPVEHAEAVRMQTAQADAQDPSRRQTAFVIDHEGKFGVKAAVAGPLGPAELDAVVDAEYDQRPHPWLIAVFALPFVLIGFVWIKLLLRRRTQKVA